VRLRFLLDTNVLSEPRRPRPDPRVVATLTANSDVVATAAPVWHELRFGVSRLPPSRRRDALSAYLADVIAASVPILPYDEEAADWHALERARLAGLGQTPPFVDGQIAAIAAVNDLVLVSANAADFQAFAGLEVVDWRTPPPRRRHA
jgi:tRNA(fMet)-specific endonuclease VapC